MAIGTTEPSRLAMSEASPVEILRAQAAAERAAGRWDRAADLWRAAAEADPGAAEPHHHLGVEFERQGRLAEAEAELRRALTLDAGARSTMQTLALLLLSQGRFAEGFELFEARHDQPNLAKPPLPYPEWRGEPLKGKRLLIWPEQGYGDQIQFARFAPILAAQGAQVTLLCRPGLERLLAGSLGVEVLAAAGPVEFPDPDYWVMTVSLAARMGVTLETIPGAPYLRPPEPPPARTGGFKVGLVTSGSAAHVNDANRSLPPEAAARLRRLDAAIVELDPARSGARDFADTAAVVAGLDLVISVDTSVAHLAGAMGKPCWTLIPAVATDWRWLREREDSPWYPSMRLYRQARAGDWTAELDRIEVDLARLIDAGRR
jgi:tetratricopeptide (TPR) repeat protein